MLFEMQQEVDTKVEEVQKRFEKMGFPRFSIKTKVDRLKAGRAGSAYSQVNLIVISTDYYREFPQRIIDITVPHEVCHLYVHKYYPRAKQAHGPEFRRMMNLLDLEGKTYHNMKLENGPVRKARIKTRFLYTVKSGVKEFHLTKGQHDNVVRGRSSFSYKGETLIYTGKIVTFK